MRLRFRALDWGRCASYDNHSSVTQDNAFRQSLFFRRAPRVVDAAVSAADVDFYSLRGPAPVEDRVVKLPSEYDDQHAEREGPAASRTLPTSKRLYKLRWRIESALNLSLQIRPFLRTQHQRRDRPASPQRAIFAFRNAEESMPNIIEGLRVQDAPFIDQRIQFANFSGKLNNPFCFSRLIR